MSISGTDLLHVRDRNLEKFGALKAVRAEGRELIFMILISSRIRFVDRIWHRCWIVRGSIIWLARLYLPDYAAIVTIGNLASSRCREGWW